MRVEKIVVGVLNTNCYIVINDKNEAIVIDPGAEAKKIIKLLKAYKVKGILITHYHFDHVGALEELEKEYLLKANDKINEFSYEIIDTPGHTMDSKSFYFPELNALFDGDFIFFQSIGRTDLGGDNNVMKKSIKAIFNHFPNDIIIYPGHGPSTTLEYERNFLESIT